MYKPELYGDDKRLAGQITLSYVLDATLKLFAPYTPFICDEVYSWKFAKDDKASIHTQAWPQAQKNHEFAAEQEAGDLAVSIIGAARREKTHNGVSQKHEIISLTISCTSAQEKHLLSVLDDIKMTITAKDVKFTEAEEEFALSMKLAPKVEKS